MFTLIELLVVVAIISILAAMLLPVLGRARAQARVATCSSSLKQVSLAIQFYADENDDYVPSKDSLWSAGLDRYGRPPGVTPNPAAVGRFRDLVRQGYMSQDLLYCPAQSRPNKWYPGYIVGQDSANLIKSPGHGGTGDWIYIGGGLMTLGPHPTYTTYRDQSLRFADMNAAKWPMVMDRIADPTHRYYLDGATNHEPGRCRGGNVVYADGHLEWITLTKTRRSWGNDTTSTNVPIDEYGYSVPHTRGTRWYDSLSGSTIYAPTITNRGYLYRVP